jgi:flagellar basal body-associated protein FliL
MSGPKKEEPAAEGAAKPKGRGKLIVIMLAVMLLLGGAGGAVAYFLLGIGKTEPVVAEGEAGHGASSEHGEGAAAEAGAAGHAEAAGGDHAGGGEASAPAPAKEAAGESGGHGGGGGDAGGDLSGPQFVNVPPLLVNLSGGPRTRFLRLTLAVEVNDAQGKSVLTAQMPKLIDSMQIYLRTLGLESFNTVAGLTTVRHDLLARVNRIDPAIGAKAVLFQDLMVQ